jgi:hypothetical protein
MVGDVCTSNTVGTLSPSDSLLGTFFSVFMRRGCLLPSWFKGSLVQAKHAEKITCRPLYVLEIEISSAMSFYCQELMRGSSREQLLIVSK